MVAAKLFQGLERPLTEDDFWALPDDENRYEIILGELYVMPPPVPAHEDISQHLNLILLLTVGATGLGKVMTAPVGVRLTAIDVVQPDLVVVRAGREHLIGGREIDGPPDLVVEILSPSTRGKDLVKKRGQYQNAQIPEYWIVDPENRTVDVLILDGEQYRARPNVNGKATSRAFPTVEVDVERLFSGELHIPATTPSTTG